MIFKINYRADLIGALASSLCVIHCMATPFIFFIKSSADLCCSETPTWWQSIDYIFLTVAFFAVLHIANNKRSSKLIKSLLIIADKQMVSFGYVQKLQKVLSDAGFRSDVFDETVPDPTDLVVLNGIKFLEECKNDAVIGFHYASWVFI